MDVIKDILQENEKRHKLLPFNPITGQGSVGKRQFVYIDDFPIPAQYLPIEMLNVPLVADIIQAGSIRKLLSSHKIKQPDGTPIPNTPEAVSNIISAFVRIRFRYDFPFWAYSVVFIKAKGGGSDIHFRLNRPQRHLLSVLEEMRLAGKPIRLVILKARQWGGSTLVQMYFAWLQLIHKTGLNSLIAANVKDASVEILDMFNRMLSNYPAELLHHLGDAYNADEDKWEGVGNTGNIHRIPQRNCKIKIGTAEKPDSVRGGDYSLVHCSEVGLWRTTERRTPEDIVRSACSGVLLKPYTAIIYESTANGTGNFFHHEYIAAKQGQSQFSALFIPWYEIEQYSLPFTSGPTRRAFARRLYEHRNAAETESDRQEAGQYLWQLWEKGATLEALNWYIEERRKYSGHDQMAAEFPSDDIEAFTFSGAHVFPATDIEQFRTSCRPPILTGDLYARADTGAEALQNLYFKPNPEGRLQIWDDVERDTDSIITDRYITVADVGRGLTDKADWSVVAVFDRIFMADGDKPFLVAQWRGHIETDLLAWKAAQIAMYYNSSLLVIESNTLETVNTAGDAEYILNLIKEVYPNLYARRRSAQDIREQAPLKYGFHTNVLTKRVIIRNLQAVLREHLYIERDAQCLEEYSTYIETPKGGYEAMEGCHDDLVMTRAIGLFVAMREMPLPTIIAKTPHQNRTPQAKNPTAATF